MKNKLEVMEFKKGEPLADLISELSDEANKWCARNCPHGRGFFAKLLYPLGNLPCFEDAIYHLEQIEKCTKISKLYKLYWRAKEKNINAISPLVIRKEEK